MTEVHDAFYYNLTTQLNAALLFLPQETYDAIKDPWGASADEVQSVDVDAGHDREEDDGDAPPFLLSQQPPKMSEHTLGYWHARTISVAKQKACGSVKEFDNAIERIRAREFRTHGELARAFQRSRAWPRSVRAVAIDETRVMTRAEWDASFRRLRKKASSFDPSITTARTVGSGTAALTRRQFECVFLERQDCLTFDLVVKLLRAHCWRTIHDFAGHFRQTRSWAVAFRKLCLREGVMTEKEWRACWSNSKTNYGPFSRESSNRTRSLTRS